MKTREQLEKEVISQQDAIGYAVNVAQAAKRLLDLYVPSDTKKRREFQQLYAFVVAVAGEDGLAGPRLAAFAHREGMLDAMRLSEAVASRSGHEEWKAGVRALAEEIARKAK